MERLLLNKSLDTTEDLITLLNKLTDMKIDKSVVVAQKEIGEKLESLNFTVKYKDYKTSGTHLLVFGLSKPLAIEIAYRRIRKRSLIKMNTLDGEYYKVLIISNYTEDKIHKGINAILNLGASDIEFGIYKIENQINRRVYIGSSVDIEKRFINHRTKLRNNKHENSQLQKDWNVYGEDNFIFEIIENVEKDTNLPIVEQKYIDHFSSLCNVYNWSRPMEENIKGRFEKKSSVPKIKKTKNKNSKEEIVMNKLQDTFGDKLVILHQHIGERRFYDKEALDKWFYKNITDEEILNANKLDAILNTWYCSNGFTILNTRLWKSTFKRLYNKSIDNKEYILVDFETQKELYESKYRYKRNIK